MEKVVTISRVKPFKGNGSIQMLSDGTLDVVRTIRKKSLSTLIKKLPHGRLNKIRARQRFRICPTTMRMMTCLMLCRVAEQLIAKHGLQGAETRLKQNPSLWKEMIVKTQTPSMLAVFDILADYQLENALYFFRDRIESAFESRDYCGSTHNTRQRRSKNDSIFERLAPRFTFEQALQQSIIEKGASATRNSVYQMLKNWRKSGMIGSSTNSMYIKL